MGSQQGPLYVLQPAAGSAPTPPHFLRLFHWSYLGGSNVLLCLQLVVIWRRRMPLWGRTMQRLNASNSPSLTVVAVGGAAGKRAGMMLMLCPGNPCEHLGCCNVIAPLEPGVRGLRPYGIELIGADIREHCVGS